MLFAALSRSMFPSVCLTGVSYILSVEFRRGIGTARSSRMFAYICGSECLRGVPGVFSVSSNRSSGVLGSKMSDLLKSSVKSDISSLSLSWSPCLLVEFWYVPRSAISSYDPVVDLW